MQFVNIPVSVAALEALGKAAEELFDQGFFLMNVRYLPCGAVDDVQVVGTAILWVPDAT